MWVAYHTERTILTLQGLCQIRLVVRRCRNQACSRYQQPYRPEEEGQWALPHGECGLDVIALVGTLRYREHRRVPEIHQDLKERGVQVCERTVEHAMHRYARVGDGALAAQGTFAAANAGAGASPSGHRWLATGCGS